jgi:hypothetical protein
VLIFYCPGGRVLILKHLFHSFLENGVEYGYEVECVETTYYDGSSKSNWSISGNKIRLPSGWRNIGSAASSVPGDGKFSMKYSWYQLDQSAPARGAGGSGSLC